MEKIATLIRDMGRPAIARAHWKHYRVTPPLEQMGWDFDTDEEEVVARYDYVIVSASDVMFTGPETYIFGANADGTILDWGELTGSFRGALDHAQALEGAGYTIQED